MKKEISIIIPARNEERSILRVLRSLKKTVQTTFEAIVVNDRSTDNTKAVVKKYSENNRNVKVISTKQKYGFSNAIMEGIKKSSTDTIVVVMADLCDNPKTIDKMYKKLKEGWDIVCASRYIKGGEKIGGPIIQNFFSMLVCKSLRYTVGLHTTDASNSFKMFRKSIFKNLNYKENMGVEASLDLILRAHFRGLKITDIPTTWRGRIIGESKFRLVERSPKYIKIYFWALLRHFVRYLQKSFLL